MKTLREVQGQDGLAIRSALDILAAARSWHDAMAIYFGTVRRRELTGEMMSASAYDAENKISYEVQALGEVVTALGGTIAKDEPQAKRKGRPAKADVPFVPHDADERLAKLAQVLCPANWRETHLPKIDKLYEEKVELVMQRKDVAINQAIGRELATFRRYLAIVEQQGELARQRLASTGRQVVNNLNTLRKAAIEAEREGNPPASSLLRDAM